jgi:GH15 family glucan-1,4-alpha-glucosidase
MYGIDGRQKLDEVELNHLQGYEHSQPVRIGNAAYQQLQLDIYGEMMDSIYLANKYGDAISYAGWQEVQRILEWLGKNWQRPDEGIWEVRGGAREFLHSRLMCWVAFDRALRLAQKRSLSAPFGAWLRTRDAIRADIFTNFWDDELQSFVQSKGTKNLDASVLLMPLMRFISPVDPMWRSTMKAIEARLAEDANHLGLYSEQIGPSGQHLGNFPQAFTHLALISTATYLDRVLSGKDDSVWR